MRNNKYYLCPFLCLAEAKFFCPLLYLADKKALFFKKLMNDKDTYNTKNMIKIE